MGFKKAGAKKKVKKAPGKKGRKDGWDLEGGQFKDDSLKDAESVNVGPDGVVIKEKRGPRKTQERDEYIRRGRAKIEDRKRKGQFEKKMSKKMKFGETLRLEIEEEEHAEAPKAEFVVKRVWTKNPKSVMERLQDFVEADLQRSFDSKEKVRSGVTAEQMEKSVVESDDGCSSGEEGEEEYEMDAQEYEELNGEEEPEEADDDGDALSDSEEEVGSEFDEDASEGIAQLESTQDDYGWIFKPIQIEASLKTTKDNDLKEKTNLHSKLQKLSIFDDLEVFGALHPNLSVRERLPIQCIGEISGLQKLWRSRKHESTGGNFSNNVLPYLGSYADTMIEGRDHTNDEEMLAATLLHICNHITRARTTVLKHNSKAKKRSAELAIAAAAFNAEAGKKRKKAAREVMKSEAQMPVQDFADQGYCRPRVLILCPFRGTAFEIIRNIKRILGDNTSMSNIDKFEEEFGPPDDDSDSDDEAGDIGKLTAAGKSKIKSKERKEGSEKPEDWKALFKGSNMDDDFKLGIQINPGQGKGTGEDRGAYMRMFCDFFKSDIIIASPLGLRLLIEKNSSLAGSGKLNADFLSSLEIAYLHQSDVMYMQNWEHVEYIMQRTNKLAENDHGSDFSRIRPYFLEGESIEHRQLILTTHFNDPVIQSFFRTHGQSVAGCVRIRKNWGDGCISQVITPVKQVFQLIRASSFESQEDSRFQYFKESVLNQVLRLNQAHTLIVTPSYLSFIRVRNELIRREANTAYVSEYSRDSEISRGRSKFFHGKTELMLFSGRAHFFRRFKLRGARHVIFYSLPEYAHFYPEIVNCLGDTGGSEGLGSDMSCLVLFTQYERMALERLVGAKRCAHILASAKNTFMFC